jgi:putative oxygen-independent coproporphyrinogen III oxidase
MSLTLPPPLALYVHLPWCVRKCPYCDFNSHEPRGPGGIPEHAYVQALLADLESFLPRIWGRRIESIFLGGGTPSLFSPESMDELLCGLRARLPLRPGIEITLEANPGTVEQTRFQGYRDVGINRISLGIQSFTEHSLQRLGRIHGAREAHAAVEMAQRVGFAQINLDLMFGLPGQSLQEGLSDLQTAIQAAPQHLSWYQLTLEPNTRFAAQPPSLPDEDQVDRLFTLGQEYLRAAGYTRYEISAYARPQSQCQHNRNYWEFGDYLGLGAGAHGKITEVAEQRIVRFRKPRQPEAYLRAPTQTGETRLSAKDLPFEFLLNALRLVEGVPAVYFPERTGMTLADIAGSIQQAWEQGLLETSEERLRATEFGLRFLNELTVLFLQE